MKMKLNWGAGVTAVYALFGSFYVGVRLPAAELGQMLQL